MGPASRERRVRCDLAAVGWVQGVAGQQVMAVGARVRVSMISMCLGCDSSIARPVDWEGTTGAMVPYYLTTRYAMVPCYQRRVRGECRGSVAGWYLPTTTLLPRCGRGVTGVALRDPTRCVPCTLVMATATHRHVATCDHGLRRFVQPLGLPVCLGADEVQGEVRGSCAAWP